MSKLTRDYKRKNRRGDDEGFYNVGYTLSDTKCESVVWQLGLIPRYQEVVTTGPWHYNIKPFFHRDMYFIIWNSPYDTGTQELTANTLATDVGVSWSRPISTGSWPSEDTNTELDPNLDAGEGVAIRSFTKNRTVPANLAPFTRACAHIFYSIIITWVW